MPTEAQARYWESLKKGMKGNKNGFKKGNKVKWKGNDVGYFGVHVWMVKTYGNPERCEDCGVKGKKIGRRWNIDWSNIDHKYRRVREDYVGRCHSCHKVYDYENHLSDIGSFIGSIKNKI